MKSILVRLQEWFVSQCDGDWEHGETVRIDSLDNPGWMININVDGMECEASIPEPIIINRSEHDWIFLSCEAKTLKARCGPKNLEEAMLMVLELLEKKCSEL